MFAAIREVYGIPRDENLKLRDFPTLAHTIQFVYDRRPDLKGSPAAAPVEIESPAPAAVPAVEIPRRVPLPVLRPPLALCKETGVKLGPGSRVAVALDQGGVGEELVRRLRERGAEVIILYEDERAELAGPLHGIYWLPALGREADLSEMSAAAWREANHVRVKRLSMALRNLYEAIGKPGTFLVAATRLGGHHGYGEAGATAPLGGAVVGLTKAFKRERPGALVKAVDFPSSAGTAVVVEALIEETLRDPGAVEIGREGDRRWTVGLAERAMETGHPGLKLGRDSVFVVTGAAGSIVSAIVQDLAKASGGTFHLLDLTPEPGAADPDLARFTADREGLKRDLFERLKARGERATPALVEKELARIERSREALAAIQAVRAAGGQAVWHQLDLRDTEAVAEAIEEVRSEERRVGKEW